MKKTCIFLASALLLAAAFLNMPARAQLTSTITSRLHDPGFSMGRDFWFALPSNEWGVVQADNTYINIYITSPKNTTAWIEAGGKRDSVGINAYHVATFNVPESLEMETSGIPENKGIHVYSKDADLSVYFVSHQPYSSDGSYVIPTIGWGTDYVVAAYGSFFPDSGSVPDLPSECTIVSDKDSTIVSITPSCNCRATLGYYAKGTNYNFRLDRGQSLQLMAVKATDSVHFDVTGTIIHANYPVGVIGGSMQPDIPSGFPYGDFVCEMIPPVRTWGETYYATSFAAPPNKPTHDFARYLFISSQPNQIINRHDCATGNHTVDTIPKQYGIYWDELAQGQKFWSSAPFLVVSYINSASYPDSVNGIGDPAEVVIPSREQFTDTTLFQTPQSVANIISYTNYCNIIVNVKDAGRVLFDNKKISGIPSQCIDGIWEIFTITGISPGAHTIYGSDSGVGLYLYGYGFDESYAWSSPDFVGTFQSPDTIAPKADTFGNCYTAFVRVTDSGLLPDRVDTQSGLAEIRLDSAFNMLFHLDSNWLDGTGADTAGYGMSVVEPTQPAILKVSVFDFAGNRTTITTTYAQHFATIEPPVRNLGIYLPGSPPNIAYDTLINEGAAPFIIDELHLKYGNVGFSLYDAAGGPLDMSPLAPGARRLIQIQFTDPNSQRQTDSIIFGSGCQLQSVAVIGGGGAPDFTVSSQTWPNEVLTVPPTCYTKTVNIQNFSSTAIEIDSAWWADTVHFKAVSAFPVQVPASPASVPFLIYYCPDSNSAITPNRTIGSWMSKQVDSADGTPSPRFDSLIGWALPPLSVQDANSPAIQASVIAMDDGRSLEIILPTGMTAPANFELVNVLGQSVLRAAFGAGTQTVDASGLPRGVYFWRLTAGSAKQSGKVMLGE